MAAILDIAANVPEATVRDFTRACDRYRDELGNTQAAAIRRGTIALIKGLRARTAKAKKQAPLKDVTKYDGPAETYFTCKPGEMAIFWPQDGHAPCISELPEIRKAIFKVKA